MNVYSIWPSAVCLTAVFLFACTPLLKAADAPPGAAGPRLSSLDGLRGFLALAVFFHHAAISHLYWRTGEWAPPPSHFYSLLGPAGVGMFFMITGFLFWNKLVAEGGKPNWLILYVGRIFRIAPLYLCAISCMLIVVAIKSNFMLHESVHLVTKEALQWLALGVLWPNLVNGYLGTNNVLAGVTWSLQYEWFFYISLLPLGFVLRACKNDLLVAAAGFASMTVYLLVLPPPQPSISAPVGIELFFIGMTVASLLRRNIRVPLPDQATSAIALLCVAVLFVRQTLHHSSCAEFCLLAGAAFFLIASGSTLFGVLKTKPARRLGDVSYGIYLLQGLVLTFCMGIPAVRLFSLSSPAAYWTTMTLAALALVCAVTVAHVLVEQPGIALGRFAIRPAKAKFAKAASA